MPDTLPYIILIPNNTLHSPMPDRHRPNLLLRKLGPWASVFEHRDFAYFWVAALVSNSAQWMQQLAVPFLVFDITDSNTWVGATAFAQLVPAFVINPAAGVIADRVNRRLVLIVTLVAQGIVSAAFATLWAIDGLTPWGIIILSAAQGITSGFQIATWQSFVPLLVPPEKLLTAVRLNSTQFTAARALGPLAGAGLLAFIGIGSVFVINSATFFVLIAVVATVSPRIAQPLSQGQSPVAVFKEGLRYVRARRPLVLAIMVGFCISFFGQSLVQIAAGLAKGSYGVGETGLAGFITAVGVGSIIASGFLIARGDDFRRSHTTVAGFVLYSIGLVLTSLTGDYLVGLTGFFFMGCAHVTIAISVNTSVQIQVAEKVRGRVVSIYLMGIFGGIPLGALVGGRLGDIIDLQFVYLGSGIFMAAIALLAGLVPNGVRLLDSNEDYLGEDDDTAEPEL